MIKYKKGDIFTSKANYICHQVNCKGVMGAGIAKTIRSNHDNVYKHYKEVTVGQKPALLGKILIDEIGENKNIVSMFAQYDYGRCGLYTNYSAFHECLTRIRDNVDKKSVIAFPFGIGCGLGGGDWNVINDMIKDVLKGHKVEIWKL